MDNTVVSIAAELKRPGQVSTKEFEFDPGTIEVSGRRIIFTHPLQVSLKYFYDGEGVVVDGNMEIEFIDNCARCGAEIQVSMSEPFHERFIRDSADQKENGNIVDAEEPYVFTGDRLDIHDLLSDTLLLNLPISCVCSEDCKGLCPGCGADLNYEACTCGKNDD